MKHVRKASDANEHQFPTTHHNRGWHCQANNRKKKPAFLGGRKMVNFVAWCNEQSVPSVTVGPVVPSNSVLGLRVCGSQGWI